MPHRSDLEAAHARIGALERELAAARRPRSRHRPPPPTPIPPGMELTSARDRLRISWMVPAQPWSPAARALVAVGLAVAVLVGIRAEESFALCIAGIVAGLALLLHSGERAVVEIRDGRVRVAGCAVPVGARRPISTGEIEQLYCVLWQASRRPSYQLWSLLAGGERVCLVAAIDSAEYAAFLEHELARRLPG